jgi:hypothetical protein
LIFFLFGFLRRATPDALCVDLRGLLISIAFLSLISEISLLLLKMRASDILDSLVANHCCIKAYLYLLGPLV